MQLKAFSPVPLIANSFMLETATAQLAKLTNLERMGAAYYIASDNYANVGFTADHRVEPVSKFTISEATRKAPGKLTNSILKMGDAELYTELKHILPHVDNNDYMKGNPISGTTSKAYLWITRRQPLRSGGPLRFEGGASVLKLGLVKIGAGPKLRFSHLHDDNLANDPVWIAEKIRTDAAAEAETARLAAEAEAARIAAAEEAERLAAAEDDEEEEEEEVIEKVETPEQAARRKAKKKAKKARQKANKATAEAD
jgi:hypothetical protein